MPNRNLTTDELVKANALLAEIRSRMEALAGGDNALLFAYRRKIQKELSYDERGKPMLPRTLKARKMGEQKGICPRCLNPLPEKYAVLDRLDGMGGYTSENTRLIHPDCDTAIQAERKYR